MVTVFFDYGGLTVGISEGLVIVEYLTKKAHDLNHGLFIEAVGLLLMFY